jgi:peptide/nickel transport system permease protein
VIALREREFVQAARTLNESPLRIMLSELLPNISSTIIIFIPLMIANSILLEAALSFLGAGVQAPNASWGTLISDGVQLVTSSPSLLLVPGLALVLTVLSINLFGEGVRDALDPHVNKGRKWPAS